MYIELPIKAFINAVRGRSMRLQISNMHQTSSLDSKRFAICPTSCPKSFKIVKLFGHGQHDGGQTVIFEGCCTLLSTRPRAGKRSERTYHPQLKHFEPPATHMLVLSIPKNTYARPQRAFIIIVVLPACLPAYLQVCLPVLLHSYVQCPEIILCCKQ